MEPTQNAPASSDLSEYGALLRRRWWVVAACAIVGLVAGAGLLFIQPKVYSSTAQLNIKDDPGSGEQGSKTKVNLDTEAAILKSSSVANRTKQLLRTDLSATELQDRIEVNAVPNSSVLSVTYRASNPGAAQLGARTYAQAYLNNRTEQFRASAASQVKAYREQQTALGNDLRRITTRRRQLPVNSPDRAALLVQQNLITQQISGIGEKMALLQGQAVDPGSVISDARPGKQTSPVPPLFLGSGLMVGLLLGVILALWRDRADRRLRSADDVQRLLSLPVLLNVPVKGKQPMGLLPARSQGGQAFHELAHSLGATLGHGNHVVLVTGVTSGLGASAISVNLAAALARTENDVVFVCANLPSTYATRLLHLQPGPGLSELLVHGAKLATVVQTPHELPRMRVITPGHDEDLAWERLQTQSMDRLIATLRRRAAYVIIEAPPTSTSADAQALAEVSDASIIVVEVPRAQRQHLSEAVRQLDRMGSAVLGSVVLPVQPGAMPPASGPPERPAPPAWGTADMAGRGHAAEGVAPPSGSRYEPPSPLADLGSGSGTGHGGRPGAGPDPRLEAGLGLGAELLESTPSRRGLRGSRSRQAYGPPGDNDSGHDDPPGAGVDPGEFRTQAFAAIPDPSGEDVPSRAAERLPPAYESDKFGDAAKPADNGAKGGPDRVSDL
jgi:uncharacterized protein involved in exopolysaccharide biosynthesis/Mrp family chromosome partitioning ATPase